MAPDRTGWSFSIQPINLCDSAFSASLWVKCRLHAPSLRTSCASRAAGTGQAGRTCDDPASWASLIEKLHMTRHPSLSQIPWHVIDGSMQSNCQVYHTHASCQVPGTTGLLLLRMGPGATLQLDCKLLGSTYTGLCCPAGWSERDIQADAGYRAVVGRLHTCEHHMRPIPSVSPTSIQWAPALAGASGCSSLETGPIGREGSSQLEAFSGPWGL